MKKSYLTAARSFAAASATAMTSPVTECTQSFSGAARKPLAVAATAAIPDKKERFRGAHGICWMIEAIAVLLFAGAASAENHCFR